MKKLFTLIAVLSVGLTVVGAMSQTLAEEGKWQVRSRLIVISPNDDADGDLETLGVEVKDDFTVEVDATYFFSPHFALEGILATAAQEVTVADGSSLGAVNHAPATFTAQYHFNPEGQVRPYAGAGINYTIFYDESGDLSTFDLDSGSFGVAGQAGVDFMIGENKMFNFDVKYIDIDIEVESGGASLGTADINPLVIGAGFGYRF